MAIHEGIMEQEVVGQPGTYSLNKILQIVIKDDDPFKDSKTKQIARWVYRNYEAGDHFRDAMSTALSSDDCWVDNDIYGKRLDAKILAKKLIDHSLQNNFKDSLNITYCFRLACLNCLDETLIRSLFDLKKAKYQKVCNVSEDDILKQEVTILERFWGHYITDKLEQIKENDIYFGYYDPNLNIYGLKLAYYNNEREAVSFFYKKLLEDQSISEEKKLNLLTETALYSASGTAGNWGKDVAIFCLQEAMKGKQQLDSFLEQFSHPRGPSILYRLIEEGYFDIVRQLFPIQAKFYDIEEYSSLLSVISKEYTIARKKLLHSVMEVEKEKFWQQLPEFDNNEFNFLLERFVKNGYQEAFQELWQVYNDDQRQHVLSNSAGRIICSTLYKSGDRESLKEFLLCYAKNNKVVLEYIDREYIDRFINDIDILINGYEPTGNIEKDECNKGDIIFDKIKKMLPKLIEVCNAKAQNIDVFVSSSDDSNNVDNVSECLGKLDITEEY